MRLILILFVTSILFFFVSHPVYSQVSTTPAPAPTGYSSCDLCGYCPPGAPPQNWEKCVKCIYPDLAGSDPAQKLTLLIDQSTGLPPAPADGFQYTGIGCLSTGTNSFSGSGAVGAITQRVLGIVFSIVGGLAFLYLLYGAFILMTAQANPERIDYGKRVVMGAVIGLIFTLSIVLIIRIIVSGILKIPQF